MDYNTYKSFKETNKINAAEELERQQARYFIEQLKEQYKKTSIRFCLFYCRT